MINNHENYFFLSFHKSFFAKLIWTAQSKSPKSTKVVKPFCVIEKVVNFIHTHLEHKPPRRSYIDTRYLIPQVVKFMFPVVFVLLREIAFFLWNFLDIFFCLVSVWKPSNWFHRPSGMLWSNKKLEIMSTPISHTYSNLINPLTPLYMPQSAFRSILLHPD